VNGTVAICSFDLKAPSGRLPKIHLLLITRGMISGIPLSERFPDEMSTDFQENFIA
jgi:hypothetical protein